MFLELRFSSPTLGIANPAQARGWVSTRMPTLPPEFFHRDGEGRPISDRPSPYAVHCNRGAVVIEAFGEEAVKRLQEQALPLQTAFLAANPDGQFGLQAGRVSVASSPQLIDYALHDFVVENSHSRSGLYKEQQANPERDLTPVSELVFRKALERRCALVGEELPEDAVLGDFQAKWVRPVKVGDCFLFSVELRFRANLTFSGPWYFGRLGNKGCGRLIRPALGRRGRYRAQGGAS